MWTDYVDPDVNYTSVGQLNMLKLKSNIDKVLNNDYYDLSSLGLEQAIAKSSSYVDDAIRTKSIVNFTVLSKNARPVYQTQLLGSALKTSKAISTAKSLKMMGNVLSGGRCCSVNLSVWFGSNFWHRVYGRYDNDWSRFFGPNWSKYLLSLFRR